MIRRWLGRVSRHDNRAHGRHKAPKWQPVTLIPYDIPRV